MIRVLLLILLILMLTTPLFAGLPTQSQLDKYCIQARMTVDNNIHNFIARNIVDFTNDGFVVLWGKYRENRTYYIREQFLNYEEMIEKYLRLKKELGL